MLIHGSLRIQERRDESEIYNYQWVQCLNTVESPVSNHPKCKDLVIAYGRWSLARIETQGASSEKSARYIYFMEDNLLHAISKLRSSYMSYIPSSIVHIAYVEIRECVKWSLTRV